MVTHKHKTNFFKSCRELSPNLLEILNTAVVYPQAYPAYVHHSDLAHGEASNSLECFDLCYDNMINLSSKYQLFEKQFVRKMAVLLEGTLLRTYIIN